MNRPRLLDTVSLSTIFIALAAVNAIHPARAALRSGTVAATSSMLEPRSGHSATLLPDGRVLIAGGMRRNQDFYKSAELYDPATGSFTRAGEMNLARVGHIAVLLPNGKVLIAGGWIGRGGTDEAELYDPATAKFSTIGNMIARRGRPSATLLASGDVLIAGGEAEDNESLVSAEIFHVKTLTFQSTSPMHHARIAHTATLLNDGRVLIAGGCAGEASASAELYDPKTGTFTDTGILGIPRCKHTAGLLPDGRVLIAGGSDNRGWMGNLSSAEIYDPRTAKFTTTASLNDPRFKLPDEAVRLATGQLLIAGGSKELEIFDPVSQKFVTASGQLSDHWHYLSETKLRDGSVLLAGGYPNNDQATAQAWIYRP